MTADQTLRAALERGPRRPRRRWAVALSGVGVLAIATAALLGVITLRDYRAGIEASQVATEKALEQTTAEANRAETAALEAATSAQAAQEATTSLVAAEEAAAAQAAAEEAARAAEEAAKRANQSPNSSAPAGPIKCPPGSQANSGDGPNDTSCFPSECFTITLPDPAYPQCVTAFKP